MTHRLPQKGAALFVVSALFASCATPTSYVLSPSSLDPSRRDPSPLGSTARGVSEFTPSYVKVLGGFGLNSSLDTRLVGSDFVDSGTSDGDDVEQIGGAIGWRTGPQKSVELEITRSRSDLELRRATAVMGDATARWDAVMINWIHRVDTLDFLRPYFGAGLGYATKICISQGGSSPAAAVRRDGAGGLAFQIIAGADARLAEELDASLGFRFVHSGASGDSILTGAGERVSIDGSPSSLSLLLGLRYTF